MFTDIVGYAALMAESEGRGARVQERIVEIVRARVAEHGGSLAIVGFDETFSTFPTALGAVSCAVAIQKELRGESILVLLYSWGVSPERLKKYYSDEYRPPPRRHGPLRRTETERQLDSR